MLLSTAYFPPVEYFVILAKYSSVFIDPTERYRKQSYRNRCRILTSNGVMDLRFPIIHDGRKLITEVKVDYSTPWVRQTEYAIDTAYFSSPFFEYYRDELFAIMDSHPQTLWELNALLTDFFCRKIGIPCPSREWGAESGTAPGPAPGQSSYPREIKTSGPASDLGKDLRDLIDPKKPPILTNAGYWQVFRERFGFIPNLSIMDLLFNEGPESICFLK